MTDEPRAQEAARDQRPTVDDAQWQGLHRLWVALGLAHMSMHNYVQAAERAEAMRARIDALVAENARLKTDRDAFRALGSRYQMEHNRAWDQGACQCPRCQPFHDLYHESLASDREALARVEATRG